MPPTPTFKNLSIDRHPDNIFVLTLQKPPENRLNLAFAQEIIRALRHIESELRSSSSSSSSTTSSSPSPSGAVITRGSDAKFWCTGLELDESDTNPFANTDGFYPLLHTVLDFPFPTVALLTGHTFGGACPLALAHDYRVMNSERGFFCMPPVDLGLHFDGIGALPLLKLHPKIARKMLLEAHRWTGKEALEDGVVDAIAPPAEMLEEALKVARRWAPKAKMGVYGALRAELWGEAGRGFQRISFVRSRGTSRPAVVKL